jgi:phosphatidylserine decarboxylase
MAPLLTAMLAAVLVLHFIGLRESIVFWTLALLLLLMYRDPERDIPSLPLSVLSPADGRVIKVSQMRDPYLDRDCLRISILMNALGVYTMRSPVEGKILEPPGHPEDGSKPHGVWLQTDEGDDIVLVMNRGRLNNTPRCYIRFGERIGQGRRCGFVHWGGQVDIYLPEYSRPVVDEGGKVLGGTSVIATLVHD